MDKPGRIWLIKMDAMNTVWCEDKDPTYGDTILDADRCEYVRADLLIDPKFLAEHRLMAIPCGKPCYPKRCQECATNDIILNT